MPNSSAAFTGPYIPKYIPKQNYKGARSLQSIKIDVNELGEIPSTNASTGISKKTWIAGGLIVFAILAVGVGVTAPLVIMQNQSSSTAQSSSNANSANSASSSTLTTLSTSSTNSVTGSTVSTSLSSSATTLAPGFSASGAVAAGTTAWYGYEQVTVTCTANLVNITVTITVQKTVNAAYSNAYSTFWSGTVSQSYTSTASQIIYVWTIVSGQTIQASGSPYTIEAQFSLFGVNQVTSADTYTVVATTAAGVTSTISGHF